MNKYKIIKLAGAAALAVAGLNGCATAQSSNQTQSDPSTLSTNTSPYIGVSYALAKMTNGSSYYFQPPSGATSCTFQDLSAFSGSYTSSVMVVRKSDFHPFYTNCNCALTFPVTNTTMYSFTAYVNSLTPPPTNGQSLTLQFQWNTNSP